MTPSNRSDPVADPLARRVRSTPDRTAIVDARSGESWRYDELHEAVEETAGRLAASGLGSGDRFGVLVDTSVDAVRTIHAAWRLGLRLVPLSTRLTDAEIASRASRCGLDALACDGDLVSIAEAAVDEPVVALDSIAGAGADGPDDSRGRDRPVGSGRARSSAPPGSPEHATWEAGDVAVVLFTSGTTGQSKAVDLTMGNLVASATASAFRLGVRPTDRWLLCLPVYHMGGLAPVLRSALYGTTLVVQEGFDPAAVVGTAVEHDVTGLSLVPTQLGRILDADETFGEIVRTILLGGAPTPPALFERCRRLDVPISPTYGLTETASQVATATPAQTFAHEGTVGQPLFGTEVTIVDDERRPLPPGETGEIVVRGPTVTPGYHDDPGATERSFCRYGLLTGDLGHRDEDGRLWVTGRRSDRIVTGGENVDPTEVAEVIRSHERVADVAVVGVPDPEWGERVAALVVPVADTGDGPGGPPDAEALRSFCRVRLAGYKLPKSLAFADELPRTPSGTVDRVAVRDRLLE